MFNKNYITSPRETFVSHGKQEIHEYRAPTDASAKLLREMQEEARKSLVMALHLNDNTFNFSAHCFEDMATFGELVVKARFTLNGKPQDFETRVPSHGKSQKDVILAIRDEIAKRIATDLTVSLLKQDALKFAIERLPKTISP
jgi:hypothetical protein